MAPTSSQQPPTEEKIFCKTCEHRITARDPVYHCIACDGEMHLTKKCTQLSEQVIAAIIELGANIMLLCNECVCQNKRDKFVKKAFTEKKQEEDSTILQNLTKEIESIKASVTQMNDKIEASSKTPVIRPDVPLSVPRPMMQTRPPDGIRIRGIPESNSRNERERKEHDLQAINEILVHLNVSPSVSDINRMGKFENGKSRTVLLRVQNPWEKRLILSSAAKLKNFRIPIYISRELSHSEHEIEKILLKKRKDLIDEGADRKDLSIRQMKLFRKIDTEWKEIEMEPINPVGADTAATAAD